MSRYFTTAFALALLLASQASAEDSGFARSGVLALGVDRLFGVLRVSSTAEQGSAESTGSITDVSLLTSSGGSSPYAVPRLAIDVFATDGLSVGGTLGIAIQSVDVEAPNATGGTTTSDLASGTGIIVGGRIGYGYMFSDTVGIWPKLGLTYFTAALEDEDGVEISSNGLALSADVMLVIAPVPHFGFTLGPVLDFGVTGAVEVGTTEVDNTITDFGLQAGIVGWL